MRLAVHQPDIPQNLGGLLRLGACLGVAIDVIEPCGFPLSDAKLRRAGMDYAARAVLTRHASWQAFVAARADRGGRLLLLSTHAEAPYTAFDFRADDILLLGSEGAGVPDAVRAAADAALRIPLRPGLRSLNVVAAAAMVLGEALRQTGGFPGARG